MDQLEKSRSSNPTVRVMAESDVVIVAEIESGGVVGVVHVREEQSLHAGSMAEIAALVVAAQQRGNGIGRVLLEKAESWAVSRNLSKVKLLSNVNREKAHAFYQGLAYCTNKSAHIFVKSDLNS